MANAIFNLGNRRSIRLSYGTEAVHFLTAAAWNSIYQSSPLLASLSIALGSAEKHMHLAKGVAGVQR